MSSGQQSAAPNSRLSPSVWGALQAAPLTADAGAVFIWRNPDLPRHRSRAAASANSTRACPAPAFRLVSFRGLWPAPRWRWTAPGCGLAGHEVRLTPDDEKSWARIAPLLSDAERFRPPRVRDKSPPCSDCASLTSGGFSSCFGRMGKVDEVATRSFSSCAARSAKWSIS